MTINEVISASATTLAQAIREKKISSEEVVNAYQARIEAVNPTLNAVVQLNPGAGTQARRADQALARGENIGPLHGGFPSQSKKPLK